MLNEICKLFWKRPMAVGIFYYYNCIRTDGRKYTAESAASESKSASGKMRKHLISKFVSWFSEKKLWTFLMGKCETFFFRVKIWIGQKKGKSLNLCSHEDCVRSSY